MRQLCICADDFGFSPAIDAGIVQLVAKGRLQAVSCMTQSRHWLDSAATLLPYHQQVDIGLHLNLTQQFQNTSKAMVLPLPRLMLHSALRRLDRHALEETIEQQWNLFVQVSGRPPDFIDGHQHVHQFAQVREVLLAFLQRKQFAGWVRSLAHVVALPGTRLKSLILTSLGADRLAQLCARQAVVQNQQFCGIYAFDQAEQYPRMMQQWVQQITANALLMCHPAQPDAQQAPDDPIVAARQQEFAYLCSDDFAQLISQQQVRLAPMSALLGLSSKTSRLLER